jgi:hypothetical protein
VEAIRAAHQFNPIDAEQWALSWREYAERVVGPFVTTWKAVPLWDWDLISPDPRRHTVLAIQSGGWGLVRVFPWTRTAEVLSQTRAIRRAIGKEHRDADIRRATTAGWLNMNGVPRRDIARALWRRTTGLRRPTTGQAIKNLSEEDEAKLVGRFLRKGLSYQEAERRALRAARGSEAAAVAVVRQTERRRRSSDRRLTEALLAPRAHDSLAFLVTQIIQADLEGKPEEVSRLIRDLRLALSAPPPAG